MCEKEKFEGIYCLIDSLAVAGRRYVAISSPLLTVAVPYIFLARGVIAKYIAILVHRMAYYVAHIVGFLQCHVGLV